MTDYVIVDRDGVILIIVHSAKSEPTDMVVDGATAHAGADISGVKVGDLCLGVQIAEIEKLITPRRLREATVGIDNGWLKARNEEIVALRNRGRQ